MTAIAGERYTNPGAFKIEPVVLESKLVRLEPLTQAHVEELSKLIDPTIWRWYNIRVTTREEFDAFMGRILTEQAKGLTSAYAVRIRETGELAGATRFMSLDPVNRRLEIGSTWYAPKWQRTFVNSHCKFLLLTYAFDVLNAVAVQFQTDKLNERSRKAIERLGAKLDGILRGHRICYDGRIRDSAFYSIISAEWPTVRERLAP